jgi:hypothetical protein
MKKKSTFGLAGLLLAGVSVCGCQSTSSPPLRSQPFASNTTTGIRTQPTTMTQGTQIASPNGYPSYPVQGSVASSTTGMPGTTGSMGGMSTATGVNGSMPYNQTSLGSANPSFGRPTMGTSTGSLGQSSPSMNSGLGTQPGSLNSVNGNSMDVTSRQTQYQPMGSSTSGGLNSLNPPPPSDSLLPPPPSTSTYPR